MPERRRVAALMTSIGLVLSRALVLRLRVPVTITLSPSAEAGIAAPSPLLLALTGVAVEFLGELTDGILGLGVVVAV